MNTLKLRKASMLINNKGFREECNSLRKAINELRDYDYFIDAPIIQRLQYTISVKFQYIKADYSVSTRTICDVLRTNVKTVQKLIGDYNITKRHKVHKAQSFLEDRQHFARNIINKFQTVQEVSAQTGYHKATVYNWVRDYKTFGNKMTNQAIAFRRVL